MVVDTVVADDNREIAVARVEPYPGAAIPGNLIAFHRAPGVRMVFYGTDKISADISIVIIGNDAG